jgi:hypothetical protein
MGQVQHVLKIEVSNSAKILKTKQKTALSGGFEFSGRGERLAWHKCLCRIR